MFGFVSIGILAVLGFAAFWSGVVLLIGRFGWHMLAGAYRTDAPASGRQIRLVTGRIGLSNYSGILNVSIEPDGLRLSVMSMFRPGHPPLLIPWEDITEIDVRSQVLGTSYELNIGEPWVATIALPGRVIDAIAEYGEALRARFGGEADGDGSRSGDERSLRGGGERLGPRIRK